MCDYATCYLEAIPLSSTEASHIAKGLVGIFARMGIPEEILTDQGMNFMSTMLEETYIPAAANHEDKDHPLSSPD